MMLIKRVEIENFGPYYGVHELTLEGRSRELVLVHGENMAGKTSLLNAIRWGLYGVAKDRAGEAMPTFKLINTDAYADGHRRVSVTLHLLDRDESGDTKVRLKRQRQAKRDVTRPTADRDFEEHLDVEIDGNILPSNQYDEVVNNLLPERISRFFLFDGELLKEYEELVQAESTSHAAEVKRAIEMILGVPAVLNGKDDLGVLAGEASRRFNKEARKHKEFEESAQAADRLQDEVEALERELKRLRDRLAANQADLHVCRSELEKHEHLRESALRLRQIESEITATEAAVKEKREKRRDLAKEFWRDVLDPRLKHEIEALERQRDQIGQALREKAELERRRGEQLKAIEEERCPTCGQSFPEERRLRARAELADVEDRLEQIDRTADQARHDVLGAVIRRLRDIAPAGVASAIAEIESDLAKAATALHRLRREKQTTEEALVGFDPDLYHTHDRERTRLLKLIGEVEKAIETTEEKVGKRRSELRGHQRSMREKDEPALRRLRVERDLYVNAEAVFEESIEDLVAELRGDVEREASSIFRDLTTDKTYTGLQINDNYGLMIVGANGDVVPVRSAGAEQVVALSLIGALNRLAAKRGPVIMDTPFGRLDRTHRENIMSFVPTLADQVALLVHSGELDPERDLAPVEGLISAEYEIHHVESTKSELRSRSYD
jgi:DNA sulfur modification protein DndD